MPAFVSPVDPAAWTFAANVPVTIPAGLRYAGYQAPALRATNAAGGQVRVPATGILRRVTSGALVFVEVQVNPFPIRQVASAIPGGLPTFYLIFDDAAGLTFADGETDLGAGEGRPE